MLGMVNDTWSSVEPITGKTYKWLVGDSLSGPFTVIEGETGDQFDETGDPAYQGRFIWGSVVAESVNGPSAEIFSNNVYGPIPSPGATEPEWTMRWLPGSYEGIPRNPGSGEEWEEFDDYIEMPGMFVTWDTPQVTEGYVAVIHRTITPQDNQMMQVLEFYPSEQTWNPAIGAYINSFVDQLVFEARGSDPIDTAGGIFSEHWAVIELRWDADNIYGRYNLGSWVSQALAEPIPSYNMMRINSWEGPFHPRRFRTIAYLDHAPSSDELEWLGMWLSTELAAVRNADPDGSQGPVYPELDPETPLMRTLLSSTAVTNHSGHSLTDAYAKVGPWPSSLISLAEAAGVSDAFDKIVASTIPGSPLHWRWNNDSSYPSGMRTVEDAGLWDALMITEGGPPPRAHYPAHSAAMANTLDYLCRFYYNQLVNGKSGLNSQCILWSIWPELYMWANEESGYDGWKGQFTFREALDEYDRSFMYMRQYAEWKLKQHLELPSDFRIWLSPGHRWMAEVYDDMLNGLVPGLTDPVNDLFMNLRDPDADPLKPDGIHPTAVIGYGLACLNDAFLYGHDHAQQVDPYIQPGYTDVRGVVWPAVTQAQAEYFWAKAQSVLNSYGPAGRLGEDYNWLHFDPTRDPDPLPDWEPPEEVQQNPF